MPSRGPNRGPPCAPRSDGRTGAGRRLGYVKLRHFNTDTPLKELDGVGFLPGLCQDPLFPESSHEAGPHETNAFCITLRVAKDAKPGALRVPITVKVGQESRRLFVNLNVHRAVRPERAGFPVAQWFYVDALCDFYRLKLYEEALWPILRRYMEDMREHGQDCLHLPIFTPPTDGVKRPSQLLRVELRDGK